MKDENNKYHRNGEVSTWNVFYQEWTRGYPSSFSDRLWASQNQKTRNKWIDHETKHRIN